MRIKPTSLAALLMLALAFLPQLAMAQAPQKMSYQSVIRNNSNALVINQAIGMRISILQGSASGTAVYVETQTPTTNANGLASIEIGGGVVVSGNFTAINWANGPYFVKTETDPAGGTSYSIVGTSQLLSVPYALFAENSGSSLPGPQGPAGPQGPQGPPGNGFQNGTLIGQILYWDGSSWILLNPGNQSQILTICNGLPVWTTGGVCIGLISALNCGSATHNGTLTAGVAASGVSSSVPYTGGNGGTHNGQTIPTSELTVPLFVVLRIDFSVES